MGVEVSYSQDLPHVGWVDLNDNGVAVEVVVINQNKRNGDLYFIRVDALDDIDRKRLLNVLRKREAPKYPLWDLLSNTTLGNGENALEFFHQLVRVKTAGGQIIQPGYGTMGMPQVPPQQPRANQAPQHNQAQAEPEKRGPGRPSTKK